MASYLLAAVLVDRKTVVGIEDSGYLDARNNFLLRSDHVKALPIDSNSLIPGRALSQWLPRHTRPLD